MSAMEHSREQLRKSPYPAAVVTWLLLLVCAAFSSWLCHVELQTIPDVGGGRLVLDSHDDTQYFGFICWLVRDAAMLLAAPLAAAVIFQITRMQARALA